MEKLKTSVNSPSDTVMTMLSKVALPPPPGVPLSWPLAVLKLAQAGSMSQWARIFTQPPMVVNVTISPLCRVP
jgi:hypothetical protein